MLTGARASSVGRIGLERPDIASPSVIRRTGLEVEAALQQEQIKKTSRDASLRAGLPKGSERAAIRDQAPCLECRGWDNLLGRIHPC